MSDALNDPPGELVFVYGSLRKGAANYPRMKGAIRISPGVVRGRLVKIGWFPALVLDPEAETWVWGDVFRVQEPQLQAFLEYEGIAAGAVEERDCRLTETQAYSYVGAGWGWKVRLWEWTGSLDEAMGVLSGDWLDVVRPQSAPFFTWVGGACALALPVFFASGYLSGLEGGWLELILGFCAILSPIGGWVAIYWAGRRRETAEVLRAFAIFGLVLASIPTVIVILSLAVGLMHSFF